MNRRGFLGALAAALTLDPERALWVPGKKLISIPAPPVYVRLLSSDLPHRVLVDAAPAQRLAVGDVVNLGIQRDRWYRIVRIDEQKHGAPQWRHVMVALVL